MVLKIDQSKAALTVFKSGSGRRNARVFFKGVNRIVKIVGNIEEDIRQHKINEVIKLQKELNFVTGRADIDSYHLYLIEYNDFRLFLGTIAKIIVIFEKFINRIIKNNNFKVSGRRFEAEIFKLVAKLGIKFAKLIQDTFSLAELKEKDEYSTAHNVIAQAVERKRNQFMTIVNTVARRDHASFLTRLTTSWDIRKERGEIRKIRYEFEKISRSLDGIIAIIEDGERNPRDLKRILDNLVIKFEQIGNEFRQAIGEFAIEFQLIYKINMRIFLFLLMILTADERVIRNAIEATKNSRLPQDQERLLIIELDNDLVSIGNHAYMMAKGINLIYKIEGDILHKAYELDAISREIDEKQRKLRAS